MRPTALVAETEHLEGADGEDLTIRSPLDRGDHMVIRQRVVKLSTELVPDAILRVFTSRNNQIVGRVPVACQNDAIVSFPANLLVSRQSWFNDQVLVTAVENGVAIG